MRTEFISTYVYNAGKTCTVYTPQSVSELSALLQRLKQEGNSASILGGRNSFGDVFLPASNECIDISGLNRSIAFSESSVRVGSGVRSFELLEQLLERDLYLPAMTGSYLNTIGGDISANVNGKDSWKTGNYYYNIESVQLMCADGTIARISNKDAELFNAVVGGLGVAGIILEAELKLIKRESNNVLCQRIVTRNINDTIRAFEALKVEGVDFAYAWVDGISKGANFGKGAVEIAKFVDGPRDIGLIGRVDNKKVYGLKDSFFWGAIRGGWKVAHKLGLDKAAFAAFNSMRYSWLKNATNMETKPFSTYQFPIAGLLPNWNKRFIPNGLQEIQCFFSFAVFEEAFRKLVECCSRFDVYPELCAIRRLKADDAYLSFSGDGLCVTIDYDCNNRDPEKLYKMQRALAETVIKYSGKIYLSKFPYLTAEECAAMYPKINAFKEVKKQLDPNGVFQSAASVRLGLS